MTEAAPVSASDSDGALPLEGTTVVILGAAAAYSGRLLAGMGATVVLIEPLAGCAERRSHPFAPGPLGPSSSMTFAFNAAGVRSVALDATMLDGGDVLSRVLAAADVCLDGLAWEPLGAWVDDCAAAIAATSAPV